MNLDELERSLIHAAQRELGPSTADRERHQAELLARFGGGSWGGPGSSPGAAGSPGSSSARGAPRSGASSASSGPTRPPHSPGASPLSEVLSALAVPRGSLSGAASSGGLASRGLLARAARPGEVLARASVALRGSRLGMLGLGLIVGAMVGGWFGFGLGQRGWRAARVPDGSAILPPPARPTPALPTPALSPTDLAPSGVDPQAGPAPGDSVQAVSRVPSTAGADGTEAAPGMLPGETRPPSFEPGNARASGVSGVHTAPRRKTSVDEPSSLAAELAMLQRARRALNAENGRLALGIVRELDEQFPRGILTEERSATRVLSLCQLGRVDEARQAADAFLERYPASVYAERMRGSCSADLRE